MGTTLNANNKDITNVADIDATGYYVGATQVINSSGQWIGSSAGIQGATGTQGTTGAQGTNGCLSCK